MSESRSDGNYPVYVADPRRRADAPRRERRVDLAAPGQPRVLQVNSYRMQNPQGFGLLQRDRAFEHDQELEPLENPVNDHWRLPFLVRSEGKAPVEFRAFLRRGSETLSETWSYTLEP